MTTIRPTTPDDATCVMQMYDHSRSLMRAAGNTTQWTGYPTRAQLDTDMAGGASFVVEHDGLPAGTFALVPGDEPTYHLIEHGRWIDAETPYATVHRLAKAPGTHAIGREAFAFAKERYAHLRADTHESNLAVQRLLEAEGFVYCGIVYMNDRTPRLAYEWWRYDEVDVTLRQYVEQEVLPRYDAFDTAHRRDHARRVIAKAMVTSRHSSLITHHSSLTPNLVYAAAAMHDLGLCEGREEHHLVSGRIIRADATLRHWFSEADVELIAQAAEDHRASATTPPRSLLGAIVAEADRDIEPETIVRRTVEYGLSHYPSLDREGHWQRTLQHLDEKYSKHGYIKLWLADSPNAAPLAELRALINDHSRLRPLFEQFYNPTPTHH